MITNVIKQIKLPIIEKQMSWDKLPLELRLNIFAKVHDIFEENSKIIQKYWHKYTNPQKVAKELWINFENEDPAAWGEGTFNEEPYLIIPKTEKLMKFACRVVTGKGDYDTISYWKFVMRSVNRSLWTEEFTGGPGAIMYNKIQDYLHIMAKKFNIIIDEDGYIVPTGTYQAFPL